MRYFPFILCILIALQLLSPVAVRAQYQKEQQVLIDEVLFDLQENILPFWATHAPDSNGGFYGTILNDGKPIPQSIKGGVLNARILWSFSRAYKLLKNEEFKVLADRAQSYLIDYFIDKEYGGLYWTVNSDGSINNSAKQTYGIAYGIYGLAEHYRATGNKESLNEAILLFDILEKYAFDPVNGGYIESFNRDWTKPDKYGYDGAGIAPKTMNTHLHVLEAYSLLYTVWQDKKLEKQLRDLILIFSDKILNTNTWHQMLYFTMNWESLENIDSYGHDIELSWLLYEAAQVLNDLQLLKRIENIVLNLVDTQMAEGWNKEEGYMNYESVNGNLIRKIDWWPQAESVIAFYNAWEISKDKKYLDAAILTWNFIKSNLIDNEYGEWYGGLGYDGKPSKRRPKADLWKCPYHNSRMGFELMTRSQENNK